MRRTSLVATLVFSVFALPVGLQATSGTFRGVVVKGPDETPGWMFIRSVNGMMRKVGISRAQVEYSDAVPPGKRAKLPASSIAAGVEVRVTADQGDDGEWRASRIEILKLKASEPDIEPSERSENIHSTF